MYERLGRLTIVAITALAVGAAPALADGGGAALAPSPSNATTQTSVATPSPGGASVASFASAPCWPAQAGAGATSPELGRDTLQVGSTGPGVAALQSDLAALQVPITVDGNFGPSTQAAVEQFESANGLATDGVVTAATARQLASVTNTCASTTAVSDGSVTAGLATAPLAAPSSVDRIVAAANAIAFAPYRAMGGHATWHDTGYDSSGAISYALHAARLITAPGTPTSLLGYGQAGPGRWVTIYTNGIHSFMTIGGIRFETTGQEGPGLSRWRSGIGSTTGYTARHPAGL